MKKLKFLLVASLACVGIGFASLGARAANHGDETHYVVSTTTNPNDTATYDFSGGDGTKLAVNDTFANQIVVERAGKQWQWHTSGYASIKNATWLVPVPAESAGECVYSGQTNSDVTRLYNLEDANKTVVTSVKLADFSDGNVKIPFTQENIVTVNEKTYLRFSEHAGTELKPKALKITLTTGAFAASAETVDVTYKDGEWSATETVVKGKTADCAPTRWGYTLAGVYTDEACTAAYDKASAVNGALTLFTKWTPWGTDIIADANVLDVTLMPKAFEVFGGNAMEEVTELTGTIYTMLPGASFLSNKATLPGSHGSATHAIKTGGSANASNHSNGLAINFPSAGTLTLCAKTASSGKTPVLSLFDDASAVASAAEGAPADVAELTINVPAAGKYYLGSGDGSVYLYYVAFVAAPVTSADVAVQWDDDVAKTNLRVLGTLNNVSDVSKLGDVKVKIALNKADNSTMVAEKLLSTVYTSISGLSGQGYGQQADTYYAVVILTEVQKLISDLGAVSLDITLEFVYDGVTYSDSLHLDVAQA